MFINTNPIPRILFQPIIDTFLKSYQINENKKTIIMDYYNKLLNDGVTLTWFYKYLYKILRPNHLDRDLKTFICTPFHPS